MLQDDVLTLLSRICKMTGSGGGLPEFRALKSHLRMREVEETQARRGHIEGPSGWTGGEEASLRSRVETTHKSILAH